MTKIALLAESYAENVHPPHRRWLPLAVITAAHLMAILDTTIMFVALPSAQHALGMSVGARQWIITAYTLAFAALLLPGGRLADKFGARRTLLVGAIGFALASAAGGSAISGEMLIASRALQGAFGALLVSSTKTMLIAIYTGEQERSWAIGAFSATLTVGATIGLILGGVLTAELDWRWCLFVNLALACFVVIGTLTSLPSLPGRPEIRLDTISVVLAGAGILALVYGFGEAASAGWAAPRIIAALTGSVCLLGAFVIRQAGRPNLLLPLRVVLDRNRGGALIATVFNTLSTFGMMLILTYQLQVVMHYSPLLTGFALTPFAAAAAVAAAFVAPKFLRIVPVRWLIVAGLSLSGGGLLALTGLHAASHYLPLILVATLIEGFGTGLAASPALHTALRAVLPEDAGAASAVSSAAAQLGSSIGAALLNTIAASATAGYLVSHSQALPSLAVVHGYNVSMLWGALILFIAAIPVVVLVNAGPPSRPRRHN